MSDAQQQRRARRVGPDKLVVPLRAEGPGGLVGDAMVEIGPEHPQYARWAKWCDRPSARR